MSSGDDTCYLGQSELRSSFPRGKGKELLARARARTRGWFVDPSLPQSSPVCRCLTAGIRAVKFPLMIANRTQTPPLSIPLQREISVSEEIAQTNTTLGWTDRRIDNYVVEPAAFVGLAGAACRLPGVDPDMWFIQRQDDLSARVTLQAQVACMGCPVKAACLRLGLDNDKDSLNAGVGRIGVWGGWSPAMRSHPEAKKAMPTPSLWRHVYSSLSVGNWPGAYHSTQSRPLAVSTVRDVVKAVVRTLNPLPGGVAGR